jgi:hypothetical protein
LLCGLASRCLGNLERRFGKLSGYTEAAEINGAAQNPQRLLWGWQCRYSIVQFALNLDVLPAIFVKSL